MVPFGPRGQRLWAAYCERLVGDEGGLALLQEACRTADRLDRLDALLTGEADCWARLTHDVRTESYELHIDAALSEARQQGAALTRLLQALPLKEPDDDDGDGWLDNLPAEIRDPEGPAVPDPRA